MRLMQPIHIMRHKLRVRQVDAEGKEEVITIGNFPSDIEAMRFCRKEQVLDATYDNRMPEEVMADWVNGGIGREYVKEFP